MRKYVIRGEGKILPNHELVIKVPDEIPEGVYPYSITIEPVHKETEQDRARRRTAIAEMKEFGKGRKLDGLSIREMIEDGREPDGGR